MIPTERPTAFFAALLAFLLPFAPAPGSAAELGPLAPHPRWEQLEAYQETVTRQDFVTLLDTRFAPGSAAREWIEIREDQALVKRFAGDPTPFRLRFAQPGKTPRPPARHWRIPEGSPPPGRPLAGLHIAIDPGHLGGRWAEMEERSMRHGDGPPIREGDLTLAVAKRLAPALRALGARVSLVRSSPVPLTARRPATLLVRAEKELRRRGRDPSPEALRRESERLFYRTAEIRARALYANRVLRPDLILCLHFNAEAWDDPARPTMVEANHFHALLNGAYLPAELALDDVRHDMLAKLLDGGHAEELAASEALSRAFAESAGLPPYTYRGNSAAPAGDSGYVWARNLLANRLYRCPTLFLEPYVMNNAAVADRIQAGDYEGLREFGGKPLPSIFREYAAAVASGLARWRDPSSGAR